MQVSVCVCVVQVVFHNTSEFCAWNTCVPLGFLQHLVAFVESSLNQGDPYKEKKKKKALSTTY